VPQYWTINYQEKVVFEKKKTKKLGTLKNQYQRKIAMVNGLQQNKTNYNHLR